MPEWIKCKTPGVRYRLHESRKHGVGYDRYFTIRYRLPGEKNDEGYYEIDGKKKKSNEVSEGLGWASEGWSERKAAATLASLKANHTKGEGPKTLHESRDIRRREDKAESDRIAQEKAENEIKSLRMMDKVFEKYCEASTYKKSLKDEIGYYRNWISPAIGNKRLDQIILLDLERIRKRMTDAGKAPRSIQYIKNIVRQIYHFAIAHKLYFGEVPTTHFLRKHKIDNKRQRYLSPEEASLLLEEIRIHSEKTYQISLLSLNSGMRFGEIAALRWQHVNIGNREIHVIDAKNGESRGVFMTAAVFDMFAGMERGKPDELVFPARHRRNTSGLGEACDSDYKMSAISNAFDRAVQKMGLNDGITDRRMKVVFHSLRHSCASWLVNSGVELPVIAKILGHKTLAMTMRYSHVNDKSVKSAMNLLDDQQLTTRKTTSIRGKR